MIKTSLLVPSNYYTRSRDFQLLGRILDCVANSSKSYSDMVKYTAICNNTDRRLLDLITKTVGFETKREYDDNDLFVLCSTFKDILRRKGTKSAVEDCVRVLLKSQNIDKPFQVIDDDDNLPDEQVKNFSLSIFVPVELEDIALLEDMLDYILPAGYLYSIVNTDKIIEGIESDAAAVSKDPDDEIKVYHNSELGQVFDGTEADKNKTELSVVYAKD